MSNHKLSQHLHQGTSNERSKDAGSLFLTQLDKTSKLAPLKPSVPPGKVGDKGIETLLPCLRSIPEVQQIGSWK